MIDDLGEDGKSRRLRKTALVLSMIGALGSLAITIRKGHHNKSVLLIVIFAAWVLSPFIMLFLVERISRRWTIPTQSKFHTLMLILSFASLLGYSGLLSPVGTKPAFPFLVIPLISWAAIAIVFFFFRSKIN